jgi:hypothetical protein
LLAQFDGQSRSIERRMNGVTRLRMGELEIQAGTSRQASTRPTGREACRSEITEMGPGVGIHGASKGLESSRA